MTGMTKKGILLRLAVLAAWILLVLYPNPVQLAASAYRLKNPPLDPGLVSSMAGELEGAGPAEIEQHVYSELPYHFDWEVYSMPWYFPTLEEALSAGRGDCKARFLLFASLMEELDLPYRKVVSLTHVWVDYEGKAESGLENEREALVVVGEDGRARFSLPRPDPTRSWRSFYRGFWEVMPGRRKALLLAGIPVVFTLFEAPRLFAIPGEPLPMKTGPAGRVLGVKTEPAGGELNPRRRRPCPGEAD